MEVILVFIVVFLLIHFIQLHIKAGRRIRALEKQVKDLEGNFSNSIDSLIDMAKLIDILIERSNHDGKELITIRANILNKPKEKS